MALIIPVGTATATSSSITLGDGESKFLALAPATSGYLSGTEVVEIQYQANGEWETIGYIRAWPISERATIVSGPGVYRARRPVQPTAVGVEAV